MAGSVAVFLLLIGLVLVWLRFAKVKEIALYLVKKRCQQEQVDLLDDTITLKRISLAKDSEGRVCLKRVYQYSFYIADEDKRVTRLITMLGIEPETSQNKDNIVRLSDFRD